MALPAVVLALGGVVVGVAATRLYSLARHRQERRTAYQQALYQQRLEAGQRAFYWLNQLRKTLSLPDRQERRQGVADVAAQMQQWWEEGGLYLDKASRASFQRVVRDAILWSSDDKGIGAVFDSFNAAWQDGQRLRRSGRRKPSPRGNDVLSSEPN